MASEEDGVRWDRNFFNVIFLGISFMLVFTAFQTGAMVQPVVLDSVTGMSTSNGYMSLAIIYLVFALANWVAAPIVVVLGPRVSMFIGALIYTLFVASFLFPKVWLLYLMSSLLGIAAAVIWTAQGKFLTLNSTDVTMARNSGVFWAIFQCSLLFGNLFVHLEFRGLTNIAPDVRRTVYGSLGATGLLGTLLIIVLRKPSKSTTDDTADSIEFNDRSAGGMELFSKMRDEFGTAWKMFWTKNMALLSATFFYTGFELTFFSSVYGTCITHTDKFGSEADSLIGISGMLIGGGEIIGGLVFGIFGKKTNKYGRDLVVLLGYVIHMAAFFLIFINLPDDSPVSKTVGAATYIDSNKYIALVCSFMLGFGDSCFNTQIYSIIGVLYPERSGPAFSLFKFVQSFSAAIGFFYSNVIGLKWQLLILVVTGTVGSFTYFISEWNQYKPSSYRKIED